MSPSQFQISFQIDMKTLAILLFALASASATEIRCEYSDTKWNESPEPLYTCKVLGMDGENRSLITSVRPGGHLTRK